MLTSPWLSRTSWFVSHTCVAISAALCRAADGLPLLFAFSGCEFSGHGFLWCLCSAQDVMAANTAKESLITLGQNSICFPLKSQGGLPTQAREGSGYVSLAGCQSVGCSIQPSPLFPGSSSAQDPSSIPTAEAHCPHCLARCVCGASPQHSQRSGWNRGSGRGWQHSGQAES